MRPTILSGDGSTSRRQSLGLKPTCRQSSDATAQGAPSAEAPTPCSTRPLTGHKHQQPIGADPLQNPMGAPLFGKTPTTTLRQKTTIGELVGG
jgi:hypothetical protein